MQEVTRIRTEMRLEVPELPCHEFVEQREELAPASPVAGVVAISAVEPASLALDLLCKLSMAVAAASSATGNNLERVGAT